MTAISLAASPYRECYIPVLDELGQIARYAYSFFSSANSSLPPGTNGHPLVGSVPELAAHDFRLLRFLDSYQRKYGAEGICRLTLGNRIFYIVTEPNKAMAVLKAPRRYVRGKTMKVWGDHLSKGGLQEGEATQADRRAAIRVIGRDRISNFYGAVRSVAKEWAAIAPKSGDSFDLMAFSKRGTLAALGRTIMMRDPNDPEEENPFSLDHSNEVRCTRFLDAYAILFKSLASRMVSVSNNVPIVGSALYSQLYPQEQKEFEAAKATLKEILIPIYRKLLSDPGSIRPGSHFDHMITVFGIDRDDPDYEQMLEKSVGFLQAAFGTSSDVLGWILYALSMHPEIQEKLRADLHEKVFANGEPSSLNDLKESSYLFQVIAEGIRLYTPLPILSRDVEEDGEFEGYQVEQGAAFLISPYLIHRNPAVWNNPETFDPARFGKEKLTDGRYMPFLGGPHRCPGSFFAEQELALMLVFLLRNRTIAPDPESPGPAGVHWAITLQPEKPIIAMLNDQ